MDTELESLENQIRRNNIRTMGVPEDSAREKSWDDTDNVAKQLIKDKLNIHFPVKSTGTIATKWRPKFPTQLISKIPSLRFGAKCTLPRQKIHKNKVKIS